MHPGAHPARVASVPARGRSAPRLPGSCAVPRSARGAVPPRDFSAALAGTIPRIVLTARSGRRGSPSRLRRFGPPPSRLPRHPRGGCGRAEECQALRHSRGGCGRSEGYLGGGLKSHTDTFPERHRPRIRNTTNISCVFTRVGIPARGAVPPRDSSAALAGTIPRIVLTARSARRGSPSHLRCSVRRRSGCLVIRGAAAALRRGALGRGTAGSGHARRAAGCSLWDRALRPATVQVASSFAGRLRPCRRVPGASSFAGRLRPCRRVPGASSFARRLRPSRIFELAQKAVPRETRYKRK